MWLSKKHSRTEPKNLLDSALSFLLTFGEKNNNLAYALFIDKVLHKICMSSINGIKEGSVGSVYGVHMKSNQLRISHVAMHTRLEEHGNI